MDKGNGFWLSLEKYLGKVTRRSPLPWQWIGIGMVIIVILTSLLNVKNSLVGAKDTKGAIEMTVRRGDYAMARDLLNHYTVRPLNNLVLGAGSELEDRVYPERVVERKISDLETKLEIYPGNREIYKELASLYGQLNNQELSDEYLEKARVLDPNEVEF